MTRHEKEDPEQPTTGKEKAEISLFLGHSLSSKNVGDRTVMTIY